MAVKVVESEPTAIVYVQSASSDEVHQCTRFGTARWECSCNGYRARRACPHVAVARDAAAGAKFDGVRVDFAR